MTEMLVPVDPAWEAAMADTFGQLHPGRFTDAAGATSLSTNVASAGGFDSHHR